jgi:hypothetical protein
MRLRIRHVFGYCEHYNKPSGFRNVFTLLPTLFDLMIIIIFGENNTLRSSSL